MTVAADEEFDIRAFDGLVGPTAQGRGRRGRSLSRRVDTLAPGLGSVLRTVRRPQPLVWYGDLDPRSWLGVGRLSRHFGLGPSDLRRAAALVRAARSGGRVMATLPRSGSNWFHTALASALSEAHGYGGGYHYEPNRTLRGDGEWIVDGPRWVWSALPANLAAQLRADRGGLDLPGAFFTSHEPIDRPLVAADGPRPVVMVRHPRAATESYVRMLGVERMAADAAVRAVRLGRVRRWFTVWERRLSDPGTRAATLVLRYEDVRADPVDALRRLSHHWGLGLDDAVLARAVERCHWDRMAEAVPAEQTTTARISVSARAPLPDGLRTHIEAACSGLGTGFGYER